jgi:hypothetical protein
MLGNGSAIPNQQSRLTEQPNLSRYTINILGRLNMIFIYQYYEMSIIFYIFCNNFTQDAGQWCTKIYIIHVRCETIFQRRDMRWRIIYVEIFNTF